MSSWLKRLSDGSECSCHVASAGKRPSAASTMLRMSRRMCSWALHGARELSLQGAAQRLGLTHTPLLPPLLPPAATATPWWSRGFAGSAVSPQRLPSAAYPQRAPPLYRAAVPQLPAAAAEVRRGYAIRMKAKKHTKGGKMKLPSSFKEVRV